MKQKNLLTFIAGALVGAGLTWLFTSKEGKEFVQKVKTGGQDLKNKVLNELDELNKKMDQQNKA